MHSSRQQSARQEACWEACWAYCVNTQNETSITRNFIASYQQSSSDGRSLEKKKVDSIRSVRINSNRFSLHFCTNDR